MLHLGSSLSLRACARLGSCLSVMDLLALGSAMALRSFSRLGSGVAVCDFVHLGSALSMRSLPSPRNSLHFDSINLKAGSI